MATFPIIKAITLSSYKIPLTEPFTYPGNQISERRGFVIFITDSSGKTGCGEISPLPGLDIISPEQCLAELKKFIDTAAGREIRYDNFMQELPLFGLLDMVPEAGPLTLFGIESALAMLVMKNGGNLQGPFLNMTGPGINIKMNGLFMPERDNRAAAAAIRYLKENSFETVKVKIGRLDPGIEIGQIKELCLSMGKNVSIRLDGNRSMEMDALMEYHSSLKDIPVEYIEEPLASGDLSRLPWPAALDESLGDYIDIREPSPGSIPSWVKALIIKPGSVQGLHGIMKIMRIAGDKGITVTLSSSYNTGLGIAMLGAIASSSEHTRENAHGLDTYKYLEWDVLAKRLRVDKGKLEIPRGLFHGGFPLDLSALADVEL